MAQASMVVQEGPIHQQEIAIARNLRCTVCQAESLAVSQAGIARDMRKIIRQKLRQGESPAQIRAYFVARYGDYILLKPPFDARGAVLWIAPFVLAAVLGGIAWGIMRRRARAPDPPPAPELTLTERGRIEEWTRRE